MRNRSKKLSPGVKPRLATGSAPGLPPLQTYKPIVCQYCGSQSVEQRGSWRDHMGVLWLYYYCNDSKAQCVGEDGYRKSFKVRVVIPRTDLPEDLRLRPGSPQQEPLDPE